MKDDGERPIEYYRGKHIDSMNPAELRESLKEVLGLYVDLRKKVEKDLGKKG